MMLAHKLFVKGDLFLKKKRNIFLNCQSNSNQPPTTTSPSKEKLFSHNQFILSKSRPKMIHFVISFFGHTKLQNYKNWQNKFYELLKKECSLEIHKNALKMHPKAITPCLLPHVRSTLILYSLLR